MAKNRRKKNRERTRRAQQKQEKAEVAEPIKADEVYQLARRLAVEGRRDEARRVYGELGVAGAPTRALVANDLAALAVVDGDFASGLRGFEEALGIDGGCEVARGNLRMLQEDRPSPPAPLPGGEWGELMAPSPLWGVGWGVGQGITPSACPSPPTPLPGGETAAAVKVAIVSFLFNWPSTGGGIVHTVELARFLGKAGYDVRHFFARYPQWGVGTVEGPLPFASEGLEFDQGTWNVPAIQGRFRQAVDAFGPDYVIVTDSWNMKPILAEAVREYPYILRFQAMECLCPLNNVRLLLDGPGQVRQCQRHQLANPDICTRCVSERGHRSGSLHQAERALSGFGTREYQERLMRVMRGAEAVLVVNPLQEAMVSPYCECVRVVTAGMDPARFPATYQAPTRRDGKGVILFAGLVEEPMKGFDVLHRACELLWQRRQDFELVATADPGGQADAFTRLIGWQSQEDLPRHLLDADVLAMPTIAQEALGRTAVEAMAAGRPVVASRLGGLPFTVVDGATGLLCEPGDSDDLARKIETLLDDAALRERLGQAGRRRFEEHYSWDVIIERHYRPLLGRAMREKQRH